MKIVLLEDIPKEAKDCPEDLLYLYKLCLQMERLCDEARGIGLSAMQVGLPLKLYIVKYEKYRHFVNCGYEGEGKLNSIEGCLSLGVRQFEVSRFSKIRLKGNELIAEEKLKLDVIDESLSGVYAVVHQHEVDHAFGRDKMIDKIGKEIEIWR